MADQRIAPVIRARRQLPAVRAGNRLFSLEFSAASSWKGFNDICSPGGPS